MAWLPFQKWQCHDDLAVTVNDAAPWTEESDIDNSLSGNFEDIVNEAIVEAAIYQEDIEPDAIEPEACDPFTAGRIPLDVVQMCFIILDHFICPLNNGTN